MSHHHYEDIAVSDNGSTGIGTTSPKTKLSTNPNQHLIDLLKDGLVQSYNINTNAVSTKITLDIISVPGIRNSTSVQTDHMIMDTIIENIKKDLK